MFQSFGLTGGRPVEEDVTILNVSLSRVHLTTFSMGRPPVGRNDRAMCCNLGNNTKDETLQFHSSEFTNKEIIMTKFLDFWDTRCMY